MRYTAAKFGWLGSISTDVGVCAFRSDAGIGSWADMQTKHYKTISALLAPCGIETGWR